MCTKPLGLSSSKFHPLLSAFEFQLPEIMKFAMKFKRVAEAFEEFSRICYETENGSQTDLAELVKSFLEREFREQRKSDDGDEDSNNNLFGDREMESNFESRELLKFLFCGENDAVRRSIRLEVEKACREINVRIESSPLDFKRRLVAKLRNGGFDARLCKSKCEKNDRRTFGEYEYVEVNTLRDRYIVEVYLAGEFKIALPTDDYAALLENLPPIFVGKPDELRQVVRIMCNAIRKSMKSVGISVPPWRRIGYMESKWFGSTNENGRVEFVSVNGTSFYCRGEFAPGAGVRIGHLGAVLNR